MRIRRLHEDHDIEVYAIYWIDGKRYHLAIPYDGYDGVLVFTEDDCAVTNPSLDGFVLRKSGSNRDILVHWAAEKGDLLDGLIEHSADAVVELHRRIREDRPQS